MVHPGHESNQRHLADKGTVPKGCRIFTEYLEDRRKQWRSLGQSRFASTVQYNSSRLTVALTGHCYLMMDDLQQAYSAYQQALYHLRDPKVQKRKKKKKKKKKINT